jgi:dual-specificity kinase
MSTLAQGPRGLNHLLSHQGYQTNGVHHPAHPLSHYQNQTDTQQSDSPLSSIATTSDANHSRMLPQPEGRQLRSSRRQQRAPDWGSFYKNGVPRATEVIVIDDSPEPPAPPPHSQTGVNSNNHTLPASAAAGTAGRKRKYEDTASQSSYQNGTRYASGSSRKHSTPDSYQDGDTLYVPSANTSTESSSIRAAPKRKRVTKAQPTGSVSFKRQDTKVLRGDHAEYRGLGRKATKASPVSVRAIHASWPRPDIDVLGFTNSHFLRLHTRIRTSRLMTTMVIISSFRTLS